MEEQPEARHTSLSLTFQHTHKSHHHPFPTTGEGNVQRSILKHTAWHYSPHQHSIAILWWRGKWSVCPHSHFVLQTCRICPSQLHRAMGGNSRDWIYLSPHTQWHACGWKNSLPWFYIIFLSSLLRVICFKTTTAGDKTTFFKTCLPLNMTKWCVWF